VIWLVTKAESHKRAPLPPIRLKQAEQKQLKQMMSRGRHSSRVLRRVRVLQLLHRKMSARDTSVGAGVGEGTVYRVARRYAGGGIDAAIYERTRPGKKRLLGPRQQAEIVAMVCSQPPPGRARWTVRLVAKEAVERNLVATVSRETVRELLADHELKPWREKNVVRAEP
jgi:putative transposase